MKSDDLFYELGYTKFECYGITEYTHKKRDRVIRFDRGGNVRCYHQTNYKPISLSKEEIKAMYEKEKERES